MKMNLPNTEIHKTEKRLTKIHSNKGINAIFCGIVLGFVFSFLVAYNGVINSNDFSYANALKRNTTETDVSESIDLAEYLYNEVRVLCVVMTTADAIKDRGDIIMNTWGKRCNKILFFSDQPDNSIKNVIKLKNNNNNNEKLREAMKYVYKHQMNDFDWILKTNDNSFIILENLRYVLYQYDNQWPVVIGQRFLSEDYMIGDYAISKEAFKRLLEHGYTNPEICNQDGTEDDKEIAKCFQHLNILQIDGIDDDGRGMFFQNNPESAVFPIKTDEYDKWYWHKLKQGIKNCCSDRLIAVQNYYSTHLYYMEYFVYKVHAFGRKRNREPLPQKLRLEEVIKTKF